MTVKLTVELPDEGIGDDFPDHGALARELLLAALVKWYEQGRVSGGWAAQAAGVSRAEFLRILGEYGVPAIQTTPDELVGEVLNARRNR
jgi:predicted HTH domain antitoxin